MEESGLPDELEEPDVVVGVEGRLAGDAAEVEGTASAFEGDGIDAGAAINAGIAAEVVAGPEGGGEGGEVGADACGLCADEFSGVRIALLGHD